VRVAAIGRAHFDAQNASPRGHKIVDVHPEPSYRRSVDVTMQGDQSLSRSAFVRE
jgi:hypothetical protein